ncbi:MAG TPA: VOC family protein, partial [Acidimicrobiales bacterium]|nr:VOC family protein [Acidimicrobiales bacterium]
MRQKRGRARPHHMRRRRGGRLMAGNGSGSGNGGDNGSDNGGDETGGFEFRGINHLALVCRDMERTVDFYTNVLGMPLI